MTKANLKSLVTQMCHHLLENINMQEKPNKKQIVTYLQDAVMTIQEMDEEDIDSILHAKLTFSNVYKEIAKESLLSYKKTNKQFEKIAKIQEETLQNYEEQLIDVPVIKEKFNQIQEHVSKEVELANQVIAQLIEQIKELEKISNLDALTKIFNRRSLDKFLANVCDKKNIQNELHVLLLDIDDFKEVNDEYGHLAGDKTLVLVANILRKALRDGDKLFRYGGEEFFIVLNRIDESTCKKVAKRILELISSNQLVYKGEIFHITVSIGATRYISGDTPETLIDRVDKALYKSKRNGKNQMNMEIKNGI